MHGVRRLLALVLAVAVVNLSAAVAFASPPAVAILQTSGIVIVNDERAVTGQTIFSNSHIVTARRSSSVLELGNSTRLTMSEQTEVVLDFSGAGISGSLRQGEIRAFIPATRPLSVMTPDGLIATDSSQSAVFSVQVEPAGTSIAVEIGRVELRAGNNRCALAAGETLWTSSDTLANTIPPQNLSNSGRVGIFAGIGVGVAAILLIALIGDEPREMDGFGGCVIVPSGMNDGPGMCP